MEPNTPDWLDDLSSEISRVKSNSNPYVEIFSALGENKDVLKDYTFPKLLLLPQFNFSTRTQKIVNICIKNNWDIVELMIHALEDSVDIVKLVRALSWELFEELVSAILNKSSWQSVRTFRFKSPYSKRSNLEIDVLAWNKRLKSVLFIDCKRYKSPSQAPIIDAAYRQIERVHQFHEALPDLYGDPKLDWIVSDDVISIYPVLVTWRDHQVRWVKHEKKLLPIIPVETLMDFLRRDGFYDEGIFKLKWSII